MTSLSGSSLECNPRRPTPTNTNNWPSRRYCQHWQGLPRAAVGIICALVLLSSPVASEPYPGPGRQLEQQPSIDYYSTPQLHWKVQLDGKSLYHDNVVIQSPFDDDVLYVTTHSADLVVLSATNGVVAKTIVPDAHIINEGGRNVEWEMTCNSGATFGETAAGTKFVSYAVSDIPPEESEDDPITRIITVSIPDHELLWSSAHVKGENNGSPVYLRTSEGEGSYILFTHNSAVEESDSSISRTGHVTLLHADTGKLIWNETERNAGAAPLGYGPPGLSPSPTMGNYVEGQENTNDLVVWATRDQDGEGQSGYTTAFQLPVGFRGTSDQVSQTTSTVLKTVKWNAVTRPVFGADGTSMFFGVTGNQMRGWLGETRFDQNANWAVEVVRSQSDPRAPIPTTPTLSLDEKRLFVATATSELFGIDAQTGSTMWNIAGNSVFFSEARVSPDDERVYVIQSIDGVVRCHDQTTGELLWVASCDQFEEDCSNAVRSQFAISRSGEHIFYADVMGRVIALEVGQAQSTEPPASSPDDSGGWPTSESNDGSKSKTTVAGSVTLIVLGLLVALGSLVYIVLNRKYKIQKMNMDLTLSETEEDYALPSGDIDFAPDPYEDSIISKHKRDANAPTHSSMWQEERMPSKAGIFIDDDSSVYATADRLSVLLGTSNKISPLHEDFSLGAAVLV